MAVMALADNETPIICNGFKDDEYIEMAMLAQKMGRQIIPVVEKYTELPLIIKYSERVGVRPTIGLRVKLASRGSGRWKSSGGYRSKFGLSATEAMRALRGAEGARHGRLPPPAALPPGQPDHQHPPDQGRGERSGARLCRIWHAPAPACASWTSAADWASTTTAPRPISNRASTTRLQEYANDVVYHIQNVCDEAQVPHPTIVTESGRAITAYHSVLVFNVLGVSGLGEEDIPAEVPPDAEQPLIDLAETYRSLSAKNLLESYHDAQQALDQALNLFSLGYLPLEQRCLAENLYWAICRKIQKMAQRARLLPRRAGGPRRHALRHVFLQLLAVPEHAGQLGHQAVVPDHAHPPAGRAADAPCRAGRHHLRFGRQGGPVHRPARREAHAGAAHLQRRRLLPGRVSAGRLPGDPRRPAQSVRRHQRGARAPWAIPAR